MERDRVRVGGGVGGGDRACISDTHRNVKGTERHKSFKSWGQIFWQRNSGNLVWSTTSGDIYVSQTECKHMLNDCCNHRRWSMCLSFSKTIVASSSSDLQRGWKVKRHSLTGCYAKFITVLLLIISVFSQNVKVLETLLTWKAQTKA